MFENREEGWGYKLNCLACVRFWVEFSVEDGVGKEGGKKGGRQRCSLIFKNVFQELAGWLSG